MKFVKKKSADCKIQNAKFRSRILIDGGYLLKYPENHFVNFVKSFETFVVNRKPNYNHKAHKEGTKDTKEKILNDEY